MNKKFKIKELCIDDEDLGVEAISLVEYPAIEENFMKFSKENDIYTFVKVNKDKQILTGPAMIPDKMILRKDPTTNEFFYVYFSKDTVEKVAQRYLMNNNQSNVTLEHESKLNYITLVESWIVTDPENDKAKALGYSVPIGTWMCSLKINDDKVWNDLIKTEQVKGFSIEGYFAEKFNKITDPDEILLEEIKKLLSKVE